MHRTTRFSRLLLILTVAAISLSCEATRAQSTTKAPAAALEESPVQSPQPAAFPLLLAEGNLTVTVPGEWQKVKPRNRIIEAELAVRPNPREEIAKDPKAVGRLTVMAAGGSVDANITRWSRQFLPAGEAVEPKIEEDKVGDMKLTWFDASGTYLDSLRGPFGPKVEKPDHRMIAAILQTGDVGNYFFKLVGPSQVVDKHVEGFRAMVESVEKVAK